MEDERICKAGRRTNQQGENQNAFRSPERKRSIKTERERPERCSRRTEDQGRFIFNSRSRNKNKRRSTESQRKSSGNESKRFRERERRLPEGTR